VKLGNSLPDRLVCHKSQVTLSSLPQAALPGCSMCPLPPLSMAAERPVAVAAVRRAAAAPPAAAPRVRPRRPRAVGRGGRARAQLQRAAGVQPRGAANFDAVRGVLWDLHPTSPCSAVLTVLYCLYCTVLYCSVLCCTVLFCTPHCTVLYCTVLRYTVLYPSCSDTGRSKGLCAGAHAALVRLCCTPCRLQESDTMHVFHGNVDMVSPSAPPAPQSHGAVLYCTLLYCTVLSCRRSGIWHCKGYVYSASSCSC